MGGHFPPKSNDDCWPSSMVVEVWRCGGLLRRCGGLLRRCGGLLRRCGGLVRRCGGLGKEVWWSSQGGVVV